MLRFPVVLAALLLAGCGYVGDPLPPLANVPVKVADLAAVQRGARLIVQFSVPTLTTESFPIPPPVKLDLRAGTAEQFNENEWADKAKQIPAVPVKNGVARYEIPTAEWTGKELILGVRIAGGNGKHSPWSNFVVVPVLPAPVKPANVTAVAVAEGVQVTWSAPGAEFRVFRKQDDGEYAPVATVQKAEWVDNTAEFGKHYSYLVQTVAHHDKTVAESDLSDPVAITPADQFPPAIPRGLRVSTAPNSIELNWDPNGEADLAAYRVYRAVAGGAFEKIADVSAVPSYSDRAVEHGKSYRYQVAAVDRAGNESGRSAVAEVLLP